MDQFEKELAEASAQGSQIWTTERLGLFTGSNNFKLMTPSKVKSERWGDTAYTYILEKVAEDITGMETYTPDSFAMKQGKEREPIARAKFKERLDGCEIDEPGFYPYEIGGKKVAGASPDGIVKLDNKPVYGVEIKCPNNPAIHLQYMLIEDTEYMKKWFKNHYWQCQTGMMATDLPKWFFVSYCPEVKGMELFSILIDRNEDDISDLHTEIWDAYEEKERLKKHWNVKTLTV